MIIESIELRNFRNYDSLHMEFDQGTNILYGDNAQGKTNVLESIYVAGTTKSHRASKDREMISFRQEESHIKAIIKKNDIHYRIDMHLKKNKPRGIAINGIAIKKISELFGIVNIVFFSPEDLNLIKNGPAERRRFLDLELCQLDKLYVYNLVNYNKILNQRNQLLKNLNMRPEFMDTLDIWDEQLVEYGRRIIERRKAFIEELNDIVCSIHKKLSGEREELAVFYEPSCRSEELGQSLSQSRERDLKQKITNIGPHRDDMSFQIKEVDIRKYGSQGQQRTSALSLKLAEIEIVKRIIHDKPILLLDDVLSELDSNRQNHLLSSIEHVQTIITCTGLDEFIENKFQINKRYRIENGSIVE